MTFLDSNVIFDIIHSDPVWMTWSIDAYVMSAKPRRIAPVVYAEISGRYRSRSVLDTELAVLGLTLEEPTREALFKAGHAHAEYRRRGGQRNHVLPGFLIGAQAHDRGAVLITRDPRPYRAAFPDLRLITPPR